MSHDQLSTQDTVQVDEGDWLDTSEELPRRPRRTLLTPIPLGLIGVLLIVCGFIGGVLVEKGQTDSSTGAANGGLAARLAGLRSTGGTAGASAAALSDGTTPTRRFGGGRGASGGVTVGQVAYLEGDTLYVESAEGNTVKITISPGSTVTKTVTSSVKSIHPGETVVVQGSANSSGTVAASSISVGVSAGGFGRELGGLFGGGETVRGAGNRGGTSNNTSGPNEGPALFGK